MEGKKRSKHQATHTENKCAHVDNLGDEKLGNNQTTRTAIERAEINRLVGEKCTAFNEPNAQKQRNCWHNQGANTDDE